MTGEIKEVELKGRICGDCAARAGYKVSGINKFKVKKGDVEPGGSGGSPAPLMN